MTTVNESIKECIRFAQSMGVKDATCVVLTEAMLRAVCEEANIDYEPDAQGRMFVAKYSFHLHQGLEKALVLQPHALDHALRSLK